MENLKLPAFPIERKESALGFTKLELASLMIAQGLMGNSKYLEDENETIARWSVTLAKAVLEEANK